MRNSSLLQATARPVVALCHILVAALCACSDPSNVTEDPFDTSTPSDTSDSTAPVDTGDRGDSAVPDDSDDQDESDNLGDSDTADSGESLATEMGLTKYTGKITPLVHKESEKVTTYSFDPSEGPVCMRGGKFFTSVRDAGSADLVVWLQEGGVCSSKFCFSSNKAMDSMPNVDILNPKMKENPVADWNHVFVPYCDGSFFSGDAEHNDNLNNRGKRHHHGLANITAALEVTKMRFQNPERILLTGSSGGSYGLLFAGILMRHYYPDAELILMYDSGIGLGRAGDEAYLETILDEFDLYQFLPEDCTNCQENGHLTGLVGYFFERDPEVRAGMYSSWSDTILTKLYLRIPAQQFAQSLEEQTDPLHEAYPQRFRRFITKGVQHAALLGNPTTMGPGNWNTLEMPPGAMQTLMTANIKIGKLKATRIGELKMTDWLAALINNDTDVWVDISE